MLQKIDIKKKKKNYTGHLAFAREIAGSTEVEEWKFWLNIDFLAPFRPSHYQGWTLLT